MNTPDAGRPRQWVAVAPAPSDLRRAVLEVKVSSPLEGEPKSGANCQSARAGDAAAITAAPLRITSRINRTT